MWDAIALHTRGSIALYKEPEVMVMLYEVNADFGTPDFDERGKSPVTREGNAEILKEVPRLSVKEGDTQCVLSAV